MKRSSWRELRLRGLAVPCVALALACGAEDATPPDSSSGGTPASSTAGAPTQPATGGAATAGSSGSATSGSAGTDTSPPVAGGGGSGGGGGGATSTAGSNAGTAGNTSQGGSGGATAGAANGGSAGGPDPGYDPCPPKGTPCAVMPMGDSITEGFRSSQYGGYRSGLFHLALQGGKSLTFVGSAPLHGPAKVDGVTFPQQNEGIGGRRIKDLLAIVPMTITTNHPHIVLLEIGTNDIGAGAPSMATQLETLIDNILKADAKLLLVVATVVPTTTDSKTTVVEAYDKLIPAMVSSRAAQGKHITLVDMFGKFTSNTNYKSAYFKPTDDLHPNDAGYDLMAQVWYDGIKSYLK